MIPIEGKFYNWKNQKERLIYLGHNFSSNGYWHQFAKIESPDVVWSEVLTHELSMMEETNDIQVEVDRLSDGLHKLWDTQNKSKGYTQKTERNRRKRARKAAKR